MSDINDALGVEQNSDSIKPATSEEIQKTGSSGWERCAGVFLFAALGMVYFALLASRQSAAASTCPLGFIVSAIAFCRSIKEGRGFVGFISGAAILFFLIFAAVIQSSIESHARPYATW